MNYYISFKIDIPDTNISKRYYTALAIIKILQSIGYVNTSKLSGSLSNSAFYIVAISANVYNYILSKYPSNEYSLICTSSIVLNHNYTSIDCTAIHKLVEITHTQASSKTRVLVLDAYKVLNILKLLI